MGAYILDYDIKRRVGILKTTELDLVREYFSIQDPGAKFAKIKYNRAFIPTRKYAITPTGRFETGLALDIVKKITQIDSNAKIQITELLKRQILPGTDIANNKIIYPSSLSLRDYQQDVVCTAVKRGRGISMVATAGGKTLIMSTLISTLRSIGLNKKIIVITPTQLTKQTYNEFINYNNNWSCTWWTGEHEPDKSCDVIIAGSKILLSEKQDTTWMYDADALIVDEVHSLRHGNAINKIIKKFTTNMRFGFTGTLPENMLDQWIIKGLIGPVIYEKTSSDLRDEKYISQVHIQVLQMIYSDLPDYTPSGRVSGPYISEVNFIIKNSFRNKIISFIANKCDNNALILVDRLEHGDILQSIIKQNTSKQVYFIKGEVETWQRDQVKDLMEQNTNIICIAISSIFSTGINIKNLHYIIFAAGGKAKIRIIQSIGRGLRLHENKKELKIYDVFDDLKYGRKHYDKRKTLYEKEKIPYTIYQVIQP